MKTNIQHPTRNIEHRIKIAFCFSLLLLIAALCGGCSTGTGAILKSAFTKPILAETNVVAEVKTIPAVTNTVADGTNVIVTVTPESYQTNWVTNIVYRVNPATAATIEKVQEGNAMLNPTPTEPFINWGLGLLSVGLAALARFKTTQAKKKTDLLHTVIQGVEAANVPEVKTKIEEIATLLNRNKSLDKEVQAITQ